MSRNKTSRLVNEKQKCLPPLLKWIGGKSWITPFLPGCLYEFLQHPQARLVEPCAGGIAVSLFLSPRNALLNDTNEHLINLYNQVKSGFEFNLKPRNQAVTYYNYRDRFNALIKRNEHLSAEGAALFWAIIKLTYNGLSRFNNSGFYNSPFGAHATVNFKLDFRPYQKVFKQWKFICGDFAALNIMNHDFMMIDPPYHDGFTKYSKTDFTWHDQVRLAAWVCDLGAPAIITNKATPEIKRLYRRHNFKLKVVKAPRSISCTGERDRENEIIACCNM